MSFDELETLAEEAKKAGLTKDHSLLKAEIEKLKALGLPYNSHLERLQVNRIALVNLGLGLTTMVESEQEIEKAREALIQGSNPQAELRRDMIVTLKRDFPENYNPKYAELQRKLNSYGRIISKDQVKRQVVLLGGFERMRKIQIESTS